MEGKKSFILYSDLITVVKKLPRETRGDLFTTILEYVNDLNPEPADILIQVVFEPIKQQLKRDLSKWNEQRRQKSKAGKKGMKKRWGENNDEVSTMKKITEDNTVIKPITNITDNVTVSVNVTDNVDANENKNKKELNTTSCGSQKSEPLPQFEKPKIKLPTPEPLHVPCKKIFMDFFKNRNGIEYYWRGRDGKAINEIIKQMRGRGTGDPEIPDVFKTILNKIEDKWMLSNLDVSLLNSKFNQVITKIKNETKQLSYEEIKSEFKRRAEQHG